MQLTVKRLATHFGTIALAMIFATLSLPGTTLAETVLRYSDHEALGGMRTRFIKNVLFSEIERESNGRLKIEEHWNGELSVGQDALRAVGKGEIADLGIIVPEYMADSLPLHQLFKSFPVGPAGDQQVSFFRRVYASIPEFSAELERNNAVPVFLASGYPVAFFTTPPLNSLAEIKDQRWRSASFWHLDFLRNAGAIPVTMHWGEEVYKALEGRSLDGLMVNVDSGFMLKVHEKAPHVLVSRRLWLGHLYILAMNLDTWARLAVEDKAAIQRAAETAYQALGAEMDRSVDTMIDDLKESGAKVRGLENDEVDAWARMTKADEVRADWAKKQESKGIKQAHAVLRKLQATMSETMQ